MVTISPFPSLIMTSSHSRLSPVSIQTTLVGSRGSVLIPRSSMNERPSITSKCVSSDRKTVWVVVVRPSVSGHFPILTKHQLVGSVYTYQTLLT